MGGGGIDGGNTGGAGGKGEGLGGGDKGGGEGGGGEGRGISSTVYSLQLLSTSTRKLVTHAVTCTEVGLSMSLEKNRELGRRSR